MFTDPYYQGSVWEPSTQRNLLHSTNSTSLTSSTPPKVFGYCMTPLHHLQQASPVHKPTAQLHHLAGPACKVLAQLRHTFHQATSKQIPPVRGLFYLRNSTSPNPKKEMLQLSMVLWHRQKLGLGEPRRWRRGPRWRPVTVAEGAPTAAPGDCGGRSPDGGLRLRRGPAPVGAANGRKENKHLTVIYVIMA